jgi:hypothetical protein
MLPLEYGPSSQAFVFTTVGPHTTLPDVMLTEICAGGTALLRRSTLETVTALIPLATALNVSVNSTPVPVTLAFVSRAWSTSIELTEELIVVGNVVALIVPPVDKNLPPVVTPVSWMIVLSNETTALAKRRFVILFTITFTVITSPGLALVVDGLTVTDCATADTVHRRTIIAAPAMRKSTLEEDIPAPSFI